MIFIVNFRYEIVRVLYQTLRIKHVSKGDINVVPLDISDKLFV